MSGERQADRNYRERRPGFYAVNPITNIAVAFGKHEGRVWLEAQRRNGRTPLSPLEHHLRVVEVSP